MSTEEQFLPLFMAKQQELYVEYAAKENYL